MPVPPKNQRGGIVTGWGIALPDNIVTNDDLPEAWNTSDEWITERTGIRQRHIGGTTSGLATQAGQAALDRAGVTADQIDGVILATTTPDQIVPATSATVQDALGIPAGAFDVNAACAGFVYGLIAAHGMLALGANRLLLIGSETLSRISDWDDRTVTVLVGDGAGAVVLEATDSPGQLLSWVLGADGSLRHLLKCDHGGYLYMDGKEVFRKAVRVVVDSSLEAISQAGLTPDQIDVVVPHQANLRIIQAACDRLGIPVDRAVVTIDRYANSSSASIPLALGTALDAGKIQPGNNVLLTGFGGGMTWASAVLRWGGVS
jgi:3-oxoacyl-[acyl-carrier-protein] synthase-3